MENNFLDANHRQTLSQCVEKLTTSRPSDLDQTAMKTLKKLCRISNENLNHVFNLLMHQLEADHSEIRLNAFTVLDELFRRSHVFRELVLSDFQTLLELTIETDGEFPLPPPKPAAKKLKYKTLQCIQLWNNTYGAAYKQLMLGYRFLKECKKIDFTDIETRSIAERHRNEQEIQRREAMLQKKIECILQEMKDKQMEIETTLTQVDNAFTILLETEGDIFTSDDFEEHDVKIDNELEFKDQAEIKEKQCEDDGIPNTSTVVKTAPTTDETGLHGNSSDIMREHGFGSYKFTIDLELRKKNMIVDDNNAPVINSLRELISVIKDKLLPVVEKWIQVLTKAGTNKDQLLKSIDIKHALNSCLEKYRQLNIEEIDDNRKRNEVEESDDDFEEVCEKEGYEEEVKLLPVFKDWNPSSVNSPSSQLSRDAVDKTVTTSKEDFAVASTSNLNETLTYGKTASENALNERKAKLLAKAPKLRFDEDLFQWGKKLTAPSVVKFDSLHKFWTPRENEDNEEIKPEIEASLRMRKIEFSGSFTPVKWQCRALLPNGKLCPRYDRFKCPFHGPVIARDKEGNPTNPSDIARLKEAAAKREQDKPPDWQDPELLRDIEASIGIDLTVGKKKKKSKTRYPGLTDIKAVNNNARTRLEKIVCNKSTVKRVSSTLDRLDYKRHRDKFGDQFNYTYNT